MHRTIIIWVAALLVLALAPVEARGEKTPRGQTGTKTDARSKAGPGPELPQGSAAGAVGPATRHSKAPLKTDAKKKKGCVKSCKKNSKQGAPGAEKPAPGRRRLSAKDQEVIKNLELLEEFELLSSMEIFIEVKKSR